MNIFKNDGNHMKNFNMLRVAFRCAILLVSRAVSTGDRKGCCLVCFVVKSNNVVLF